MGFCSKFFLIATFIIELLKLFIATRCLVGVKYKINYRWIAVAVAGVFGICLFFNEVDNASFFIGILAIATLSVAVKTFRNIIFIIISYMIICTTDVLIGIAAVYLCGADIYSDVQQLMMNSISLMILIPVGIVNVKNHKVVRISARNWVIQLIGIIAVSFILTFVLGEIVNGRDEGISGIKLVVLVVSSLIFFVIIFLFHKYTLKSIEMEHEIKVAGRIIEAQEQYYMMKMKTEDNTRRFRHDVNNHIKMLGNLMEEEKYDEAKLYLNELSGDLKKIVPRIKTGNDMVSVIVLDLMDRYPDVKVNWKGNLPRKMLITHKDICTIFYNVFSNAFEAVEKVNDVDKIINVDVGYFNSRVFMKVINPSFEPIEIDKGTIRSSKIESDHGYGIRNIKNALEKYQGAYDFSVERGSFTAEINWNEDIEDNENSDLR